MNAKEIMDKKFERAKVGYNPEEVDDFLREVSLEISELSSQNESLEKKLEVLADKIREYREDEEAIKDALLGAQKQGAHVLADAKAKAEEIVKEATEKAEKLVADAQAEIDEKQAEKERVIAETEAETKRLKEEGEAEMARLKAESEAKLAEITARMDAEIKKEEAILANTRAESAAFMDKLLAAYKEHIELLKKIPDEYETEFVKETVEKVEKEKAEAVEAPVEEAVAEEAEVEEKAEQTYAEEAPAQEEPKSQTQPIPFRPIFEEAPAESDADVFETRELDSDENESPFFNKNRRSKYDKIEFGKK